MAAVFLFSADGSGKEERPKHRELLAKREITKRLGLDRVEMVDLDLPAQREVAGFQTSLTIQGRAYVLQLTPYSLRAQGFELLVQADDGELHSVPAPPAHTYRGTIQGVPASTVTATLLRRGMRAVVSLPNEETWYVQPASDVVPDLPRSCHALYRQGSAAVPTSFCGVRERSGERGTGDSDRMPGLRVTRVAESTTPRLAEIAFDVDYDLYANLSEPDPLSATMDLVEALMNAVDVIFRRDVGVCFALTVVVVRTAEPDPYSTLQYEDLLRQFRNEWNSPTAGLAGLPRDVAHLLTGKPIWYHNGGVYGVAYTDTGCRFGCFDSLDQVSYPDCAYGYSAGIFLTPFGWPSLTEEALIALTAHELGHNWGAYHCNDSGCTSGSSCRIMCSSLNGCDFPKTGFSQCAIDEIVNYTSGVSCLAEPQPILYVDISRTGGSGNGSSWQNSFRSLQSALTVAEKIPGIVQEIWVAGGEYRPRWYLSGNRRASFELQDGVAIYGGFSGNETSREQRDWLANETILSGDLHANDSGFSNREDNSYHVVIASHNDATAVLDGFTIEGGNADGNGAESIGAGLFLVGGDPTIRNCRILANQALLQGAGAYVQGGAGSFENCLFQGNHSLDPEFGYGGGMWNGGGGGSPTLVGCTFRYNSAAAGGGMYNDRVEALLVNCLFSENDADRGAGLFNVVPDSSEAPELVNCTLANNSATLLGGGIFNQKLGSNGTSLTLTNCIIWGNGDGLSVAGGAPSSFDIDYCSIEGWDGALGGTKNDKLDPHFVDAVNGNFRLSVNSPSIDSGDSSAIPGTISDDLEGANRFYDDDGTPNAGAGSPSYLDRGAYEFGGITVPPPSRLYVDDSATGSDDGTNWVDAYNSLQDALSVAAGSGGVVAEIWVAEGEYVPAGVGSRATSFVLQNGVSIYGGFAGSETILEQRGDPRQNESCLSGDLLGNDGSNFSNYGDNSYHVVTASNTNSTAVLDGFTIRSGNANGSGVDSIGGGMYAFLGGATVRNCWFEQNSAENHGGGYYHQGGSGQIIHCVFEGNRVVHPGPSAGFGGGLHHGGGGASLTLVGCVFRDNVAHLGGGLYNDRVESLSINCLFHDNEADLGGGFFNFVNQGFDGPELVNCTFSENIANTEGAAMYNGKSGVGGTTVTMTNCVLWGNSDTLWAFTGFANSYIVNYCCVEGGFGLIAGSGNIQNNPQFVNSVARDLRLSSASPCIDAGDSDVIPLGEDLDLDGLERFIDDPGTSNVGAGSMPYVDMGPYEYFADCDGDDVPDYQESDADGDGLIDDCDPCTDTDGDGFGNPGYPQNTCPNDNCPETFNPGQGDADSDQVGDACDPCTDTDGDGFGDPGYPANACTEDDCPNTPAGEPVDANGCSCSELDADGDGVDDCSDLCPDTPSGQSVDTDGCSCSQFDCNEACVFTWIGPDDGLFLEGSNWDLGFLPSGLVELRNLGPHNNCILDAGGYVAVCGLTVSGAPNSQVLEVRTGTTLGVDGLASLQSGAILDLQDATLEGSVEIRSGATIQGSGNVRGDLLDVQTGGVAIVTSNDSLVLGSDVVDVRGDVQVNINATLEIESPFENRGRVEVRLGALLDTATIRTSGYSSGSDRGLYLTGANVQASQGLVTNLDTGFLESGGFSTLFCDFHNQGDGGSSGPGPDGIIQVTDDETDIQGCLTNDGFVGINPGATLRVDTLKGTGAVYGNLLCDVSCAEGVGSPKARGSSEIPILRVDDDLILEVSSTLNFSKGLIRVGGDIDIRIDDPDRFDLADGTLQMEGFFFLGSQEIEVLSSDRGARPDASSPFTIGELHLGLTPSHVTLVDNHNNSGGSESEVLYVKNLIIEDGATLDTNGQRLYYETITLGTNAVILGDPPIAYLVDCNGNGIPDDLDIASGSSKDRFPHNGIPDECDGPSRKQTWK